jgi:1,4-dihydroxy-2-naphthoyl-CoA synthase
MRLFLGYRGYSTAVADRSRQCYVSLKGTTKERNSMPDEIDGLATVMMNRPERKNAFGRQMVAELSEAIDYLQQSK